MEFPFVFPLLGMFHMFMGHFKSLFVNCLFMSFGHFPIVFLVWLSQFLNALCILNNIHLLSLIYITDIFSQFTICPSTLHMVFFTMQQFLTFIYQIMYQS